MKNAGTKEMAEYEAANPDCYDWTDQSAYLTYSMRWSKNGMSVKMKGD